VTSFLANILIVLAPLCILCCSGRTGVVRLKHDDKRNSDHLAVTTEHYLSLDGDKVLELDRGERSLTLEFRRPSALGRPADDAILVTLKLYDTDPLPQGKIRLEAETRKAEFDPLDLTRSKFAETVTILDSGQRQQDNPGLANNAQAQTGYITFGKPVAAGTAQRKWHLYKFRIQPESMFFDTVGTAKYATISIAVGKLRAEMQSTEKETAIWKRYAAGNYDEKEDTHEDR